MLHVVASLVMFKLCSIKVPLSDLIWLIVYHRQMVPVENQSITSKRVLIKRKEGARAQKGYLYKMTAIFLSTFRKFSTSLCGKQSARLELPARLVPGLLSKLLYTYVCMHIISATVHSYFIRKSVRMRVRERASLSKIKGGKDAEGERDLGLERRREGCHLMRGGERALRKENSQLNTPSDIHC